MATFFAVGVSCLEGVGVVVGCVELSSSESVYLSVCLSVSLWNCADTAYYTCLVNAPRYCNCFVRTYIFVFAVHLNAK